MTAQPPRTAARSDAPDSDARRAAGLARMRAIATGLLLLMALVFLLSSLAARRWPALAPALAYVRAFSEAGMAGACADWFAVTALFRRPLGLPIPHTAIIPRNKDRIGEALGRFIAVNFLTEAVLEEKLRALEVGRWGGAWLQRPANARGLAQGFAAVLPEVVAAAPAGLFGELAGSALVGAARATPAAATAGRILEGVRREGYGDAAIDWALGAVGRYLQENKALLARRIAAGSGWASRWLDQMLAGRMIDALVRTLEEMRAPGHRLRRMLVVALARWTRRLRTDAVLQAKVEALKGELLAHPAFTAEVEALQRGLESRVLQAIVSDRAALAPKLETAILGLGRWLADNAAARERLNAWARELAKGVIAPRGPQVGRAIAEVVAGWEARSVAERLELQVGRDLQYIRISGTLVGGLAGLVIYALARAAGLD